MTDQAAPASATLPALGVAVAQFAPTADVDANIAEIRRLTEVAVTRGAALVVFPEYSSHFAAPLGPTALAAAQPLDGPFAAALSAIARDHGVHVVAGMVESADGAHYFNTLLAFDPAGTLVATYRKLHLYDAFGGRESEWMRAGVIEHPQTFSVGPFTVGLQTCYDVRFPEVTRWLVDAGVDLVLIPSEWVPGPAKERHWNTLVTARAIENTVFIAAADHTAPGGVGLSMVVDPMGEVIASIGAQADVAVAFIDAERLAAVRRTNPALVLRRFRVVPKED
ncbi:carbon-nitrogen hydrolase family protein [Subtercola endophyticus]|uniref:carbon-nitrogen hydrolase family protein n=1 Tax=Subtercola endophyticus TaxID=2895559 RepID=UPI001E4BF728|nr:carbon-nitrogen hydrolase family protein [Subtercola endophyticus]UFS59953.1 carbon-nitrogen hydrolase family protein [Subtercola endophyticus]